jgi:dolichol-phosphate mannosyltransferase
VSTVAIPQEHAADVGEVGQLSLPRLTPETPNLFVVPAFNEADNLPRLLSDLEERPALLPAGSRVIIVDDGSEDGTPDIVEGYDGPLPLELVRLDKNQGPGAAFRAGFAAALERCPEEALVVTLEADTTSDLDALPGMLARASEDADLVLASVHLGGNMYNVSLFRRTLSAGAGWFVRTMLGINARTVSSFFRVYRASLLRSGFARYGDGLIREQGFACKAELLVKLSALDARVVEIPVDLDATRRIGKSRMKIWPTMVAYARLMLRRPAAGELDEELAGA